MTNVSVRRIAIALVGILAAAASSASAQTPENSWVLEKGEGIAVGKDNPASLRLDDKQMSGSTGCNTFRAKIDNRPDNRVAISDVALTRKMCAPKVSEVERAIVEAFGKTEFMERGSRTLTFLSGKKRAFAGLESSGKRPRRPMHRSGPGCCRLGRRAPLLRPEKRSCCAKSPERQVRRARCISLAAARLAQRLPTSSTSTSHISEFAQGA